MDSRKFHFFNYFINVKRQVELLYINYYGYQTRIVLIIENDKGIPILLLLYSMIDGCL